MEREEWITKINQLNELELELQLQGAVIRIEWFRAIYGSRVPNRSWHYHRGTEIHYLIKGEIQVFFEEGPVLVKEGQAIMIPAGVRHRLCETSSQQPFYKIVVNYHIDHGEESQEAALLGKTLLLSAWKQISISPQMQSLLELSVEEAVQKEYGFVTVIRDSLLSILTLTARAAVGDGQPEDTAPTRKSMFMERMEQIQAYAEKNLYRRISSEEVARYMNLSGKQVGRIIFHCTGKNTREYLMGLKVERAKELLKNPEYSVKEVAELLGFCNEYYFNRFFKQMEGMPPGKYQKSILSQ